MIKRLLFLIRYFNPHSHEGSDGIRLDVYKLFVISIHTPTKGATPPATKAANKLSISIHTPTKGATTAANILQQIVPRFQSTLPRRERLPLLSIVTTSLSFQSTLPRRERRKGANLLRKLRDFNPHSHEGSDSNINQ